MIPEPKTAQYPFLVYWPLFVFVTVGTMLKRYIKLIRESRVYDVATVTPLVEAARLSRRFDNVIWMKREDLQPVHSFKLRGAYNKISALPPGELKRGVIAASAGNHAQGVALAARKLGVKALIVRGGQGLRRDHQAGGRYL
jgi:threonine dehydratase